MFGPPVLASGFLRSTACDFLWLPAVCGSVLDIRLLLFLVVRMGGILRFCRVSSVVRRYQGCVRKRSGKVRRTHERRGGHGLSL